MIKVLRGCILKLVLILYWTGNMQSAILLSFIASSSLPPCGLQSTYLPMPSYISPHVVYNVYDTSLQTIIEEWDRELSWCKIQDLFFSQNGLTLLDTFV